MGGSAGGEDPARHAGKRKGHRRTVTIASTRKLSRQEKADGVELLEVDTIRRPRVRGDCVDAPRPCPWVGCKYHLYLDVNPDTGGIRLNFPKLDPLEIPQTCALDVAEDSNTLEQIGELLNLTRERIRQVEVICTERLREFDELSTLLRT